MQSIIIVTSLTGWYLGPTGNQVRISLGYIFPALHSVFYSSMAAILLSTLNARYFHTSLGLRYLLANMKELRADAQLLEFIITQPPIDIVASLLERQPKIIGF